MTEAQSHGIPSPLKPEPSPTGGIAQQLLRSAPVATWCLVAVGAAGLFWGIVDNRFSTLQIEVNTRFTEQKTHFDGRFDEMKERLDRMDRRMEKGFEDVVAEIGELRALLQQTGQ